MASNFTVFNMEDGFLEGFLRGLRSTFLSDMDYQNLKEGGHRGGGDKGKEDFEDLRLTLQETDYGNFLQAEVRYLNRFSRFHRFRIRELDAGRIGSLQNIAAAMAL